MNFIKLTSAQIQQETLKRLEAGKGLIKIANSCYPSYMILNTEWHKNLNGIELKSTRYMVTDTDKNVLIVNKLFNTAQQAKIAMNTEVLHRLLEVCFVDTNKVLPEFLQAMKEQVKLLPEYLDIPPYIFQQIEENLTNDKTLIVMKGKGKVSVSILPF